MVYLVLRLTGRGPMTSLFLDANFLGPRYNCDFTNINDLNISFSRGGHDYRRPCGWKRFALKVRNKYESNVWLGSSNVSGELLCRTGLTQTPSKSLVTIGLVQKMRTFVHTGCVSRGQNSVSLFQFCLTIDCGLVLPLRRKFHQECIDSYIDINAIILSLYMQ